jgi:hypothetical protein
MTTKEEQMLRCILKLVIEDYSDKDWIYAGSGCTSIKDCRDWLDTDPEDRVDDVIDEIKGE